MSYNFVYAEVPNYKPRWYLKTSLDNLDGLIEIIEWLKGKLGTILVRQLDQLNEGRIRESEVHNPSIFIEALANNVINTLEQGKSLLWANDANRFELNEKIKVLKEIQSESYSFPDIEEVITIGKWLGGKHYYLQSNMPRNIEKLQFNSSLEAKDEALKYVDNEHIIINTSNIYGHEGD